MWSAIFEKESLENETKWSQTLTLHDKLEVHAFEYLITGTGTMDIEIYTSISGEVWISNGVKATEVGSGSGPESNGSDIIPLRLKPGDLIRFKVVVSGTLVESIWFTQK